MDKESKLEEEILASFERGEWQPSPKGKSKIARFAAMASASLTKDKRVKYVTGRLVEPQNNISSRSSGTRQKRRAP